MKPIPAKLRRGLSEKPEYQVCWLTGLTHSIKWHHAWVYAGKQINEEWNIFPVTEKKHRYEGDPDSIHKLKYTENYVKFICLNRADLDDLCKRYPKKDWKQEYRQLESKHLRRFEDDSRVKKLIRMKYEKLD